MKMIVAVVRPERLQADKDGLSSVGVCGMTITHVTGRGKQRGLVFTTRVGEFIVDEMEKVKLEIVVDDGQVDDVIASIRENADTGHPGDGRIFIVPVLESIRIRSEPGSEGQ